MYLLAKGYLQQRSDCPMSPREHENYHKKEVLELDRTCAENGRESYSKNSTSLDT